MAKETLIGGQAVIEGVMMINKLNAAIAVRTPSKKIVIKRIKLTKPRKFYQLPFIRGIFNLFRMLVIGTKAINYSASISVDEEEEEIKWWEFTLMILISLVFAISLFKLLPLFLADLLNKGNSSNVLFNITDGLIKIGIFVLYIYIISLFKDIKRVFEYHGAEHKTVHCREAKLPLTVPNVKKFSTLHPRCGTAFIILVLTLSIIVYTFIPREASFAMKFILRIVLLPVIAGISYEILRLAGLHSKNLLLRMFIQPGLWMQKLTTKEPDGKQIEVAIRSMKAVL